MSAHGTNGCYTGGCRREECRAAHRSYERERARRAYVPLTVEAYPFRRMLLALWRQRHTISEIAMVTHLPHQTIASIMDGKRQRIWIRTAVAIKTAAVMLPSEHELC